MALGPGAPTASLQQPVTGPGRLKCQLKCSRAVVIHAALCMLHCMPTASGMAGTGLSTHILLLPPGLSTSSHHGCSPAIQAVAATAHMQRDTQQPLIAATACRCRRTGSTRPVLVVHAIPRFSSSDPPSDDVQDSYDPDGHQAPRPRHISDSKQHFRYWIDFQVLSSPKSTQLLERALRLAGGICTGGPPKLDPHTAAVQKHKDYGYMHMGEWDFLWSITAKAMLAAEILRPGQLVSIIPGFLSITRKTSLVSNLRLVFGDKAFDIIPRTFKLPDEMDDWARWIETHPQDDTGMWMLKNNKQRGTGLRLVRTPDAFAACFETTYRPGLEGMKLYRWYLAQQYLAEPMLLKGYKFGIRLWVLVTGIKPLRLYVHQNGLVLLSSHRYDLSSVADAEGNVAPGHVTNYAQNENGSVWTLDQVAAYMGQALWAQLWDKMLQSTAKLFAAALPRVNEVQASTAVPPHSCFQFFGLDYLIDSSGHPWLLEANATPSMKVEHEDASIKRLIHDQKWPVVRDMVAMLGICPERFHGPPPKEHQDLSFLQAELNRRGGFVPIMHLLPSETPDGMRTIDWHKLDKKMRTFCQSKAYQACLR